MASNTITFNAPVNNYGNGTITGDVTNHVYGDKREKDQKPLILTEGKTDWKHLEFVLTKLQAQGKFTDLVIEFSKAKEHMGYAKIIEYCRSLSKTPQCRLFIGLFDRDESNINKEFNSGKEFIDYGNSVFITRIPELTEKEPDIVIENYYSSKVLDRADSQGRKLGRAGYKVTSNGSLSKDDFAENIRKETPEFSNIDVSNFEHIFRLLAKIIAEYQRLKDQI